VPGLPLGSWIQGQVGMSLFCPQRLLPEAPQLIKGPVDVAARVRSSASRDRHSRTKPPAPRKPPHRPAR